MRLESEQFGTCSSWRTSSALSNQIRWSCSHKLINSSTRNQFQTKEMSVVQLQFHTLNHFCKIWLKLWLAFRWSSTLPWRQRSSLVPFTLVFLNYSAIVLASWKMVCVAKACEATTFFWLSFEPCFVVVAWFRLSTSRLARSSLLRSLNSNQL